MDENQQGISILSDMEDEHKEHLYSEMISFYTVKKRDAVTNPL